MNDLLQSTVRLVHMLRNSITDKVMRLVHMLRNSITDKVMLSLIVFAVSAFCLFSNSFAQAPAEVFPGIVPLISTREEIARKFALPGVPSADAVFETSKSVIKATFATGPCDEYGWNVPTGTLVLLKIYPREITYFDPSGDKQFESFGLDSSKYFINRSTGLDYEMRYEFEKPRIHAVRIVPRSGEASLRCPGFPKYDPAADHYYPYQSGEVSRPDRWNPDALYLSLAYTRESRPRQVFIFVYAPKSERAAADRLVEETKNYLKGQNGIDMNLVTIIFGGIRCKLEFETFAVPVGYPPAQPRPRPFCS
ncbi:MAG: hypothetical protein IPK58_08550 [Acidobacteria bacterium]|nr:hypothetical protein [Acidobacteriota bacterium]